MQNNVQITVLTSKTLYTQDSAVLPAVHLKRKRKKKKKKKRGQKIRTDFP